MRMGRSGCLRRVGGIDRPSFAPAPRRERDPRVRTRKQRDGARTRAWCGMDARALRQGQAGTRARLAAVAKPLLRR